MRENKEEKKSKGKWKKIFKVKKLFLYVFTYFPLLRKIYVEWKYINF